MATGILQGLRAVLIYIISDAWYCESDSAQCRFNKKKVCVSIRKIQHMCFFLGFTRFKGFGSLLVIGCVLLFTVGRGRSAEKKFG